MAYIWNLVTELKRSVVYAKGALSFGNIERSIRTPLLGGRWSFSFLELLSVLAAGKLALFGHYVILLTGSSLSPWRYEIFLRNGIMMLLQLRGAYMHVNGPNATSTVQVLHLKNLLRLHRAQNYSHHICILDPLSLQMEAYCMFIENFNRYHQYRQTLEKIPLIRRISQAFLRRRQNMAY